MFTRQVGAFDRLRGTQRPDGSIWSDFAIDVLQTVFGQCQQELEHNGPITIEGPLTIENCGDEALVIECGDVNVDVPLSGTAEMLWAIATADWVSGSGNTSSVACSKCDDRDGSNPGDPITVYLPRSSGNDPNVRQDDVIGYLVDEDGDAICITDVDDDAIGTIKAWSYAPDDTDPPIPPGWEELTAGRGRVIVGYNGTTYPLDDTDGTITEGDHGGVTSAAGGEEMSSAEVGATIDDSAGDIALTGSGNTGTSGIGGEILDANLALSGTGAYYTSYEVTGISVANHQDHYHPITITSRYGNPSGTNGPGALINSVTSNNNVALDHTVVEPNAGEGHRHTWDGADAAGILDITPEHAHAMPSTSHQHSFTIAETMPVHTHDVTDPGHTHDGPEHTHEIPNIPHVEGGNLQPYLVKTWIIRTS